MKRIGLLLLFVVSIYGGARLYYRMTDDFRIAHITDELPYRQEYEVAPLSFIDRSKVDHVLQQSLSYLGKGGQSYVFATADQQYVLKIFKFKHHRPRFYVYLLPPIGVLKEIRERHIQKCEWKYHLPFQGYKLAYDQIREETALLAVHLNKTKGQYPNVIVKDKLGFEREVALDEMAFVIQKRGKEFRRVLSDDLERGDIESAHRHIESMIGLFAAEYDRGLIDQDFCVMKNTGFIGERPFRIDVGQLTKERAYSREDYLTMVKSKITEYIQNNYPDFQYCL